MIRARPTSETERESSVWLNWFDPVISLVGQISMHDRIQILYSNYFNLSQKDK